MVGAGDQCGNMLTDSGMGGMDEMGIYYDHCLESLYPPGACVSLGTSPACRPQPKTPGRERYNVCGQGTFCNEHTYQCFLTDVHAACCDEGGLNCPDGQDIPNTCPVGCAIIFPAFLETGFRV